MSYYLANEKWIDRSGDPAGLLGQRATISGLGQISRAADAKDYPALPEFFAEGLSDKVIEVREELAQLARDTCDGDVATTAKDMRDLAIGQTLLVITDGCYADTEGEGEEPVEFVGSCSPLRKRQAMLQPSEIGRPTCDFCSTEHGAYRYPTHTFIAEGLSNDQIAQQSVGDWAACPVCHDLIQKDDRAGLAVRSLNFLLRKYHGTAKNEADELYQELFILFGQFYDNRCGEPTSAVSTERTVSNEPAEKPMTKTQIAQILADYCGVTKKVAKTLLDTLAQTAITEVKKNGVFILPGIGRLVRADDDAEKPMTRTQLTQILADECEITKKVAKSLLDTLAQTAIAEVKKNGVFVLPGIGRLVRVDDGAEKPMTRTQIAQILADSCGTTKRAAQSLLDALAQTAVNEVKKNGVFVLPGIGRLVRVDSKARPGRNAPTV